MIYILTLLVGFVDSLVGEKVLLVLMDGFRWDYTQLVNTPNFDRMARLGSKANYVVSTFTTETFPCHYSIATGLYEESHGIVSNEFYDPVYNEYFNMFSKETKWWDQAEPIWVTARRQGLKTAVFFWPGSETKIKGYRPNKWKRYDETIPFNTRVDTVIDWLSKDVDFAMLYFHEPDNIGHIYGPNSEQLKVKITEMDTLLGSILQKLDIAGLSGRVNIILTSDHGMTDIDPHHIIDLNNYIDLSMIKVSTEHLGPVINILHKEGHLAELFINLKKVPHMSVYIKDDIPDKWHYKHSKRILPLLLVAEEGWLLSLGHSKPLPDDKGGHGYDNQLRSMNPMFYAKGPSIRDNFVVDHFNSVDIYPLICLLLGITPAPNNGTLDVVMNMVKKGLP